jgi:hypothetical protein
MNNKKSLQRTASPFCGNSLFSFYDDVSKCNRTQDGGIYRMVPFLSGTGLVW